MHLDTYKDWRQYGEDQTGRNQPGGLVLRPNRAILLAGAESRAREPVVAAIARAKGSFGRKVGDQKVVEKRSNEGAPGRRLDRVIDPLRLASGAHEAGIAQPAQVIGDERLSEADLFD